MRAGWIGASVVVGASLLLGCGEDPAGTDDPTPAVPPVFETHLTDPSGIGQIVPPGSISGDEIKGHSFVRFTPASVELFAPVDMTLTRATWVGGSNDYGMEFEINSRFVLRLGHVDEPRADLAALIPRSDPSSILVEVGPVFIRAGESLGRATGGGVGLVDAFDFGLYDLQTETSGPNTERYRSTRDYTKLNSVCGYAYFADGLRSAYSSRFGTIGGVAVPGADCRTIGDVVGRGGVAGEWYLTSHAPDAVYGERFAVGLDLGGLAVRIGGVDGFLDVVGASDPQDVTGEVCYEGSGRFVFIRPSSATTADVVAGAGACPTTFPDGDHRSYAR